MLAFIFSILFFTCAVDSDTKSVQYHMQISRKARSNGPALQTGYVYSKVNQNPAEIAVIGSDYASYDTSPVNAVENSDTMTFNYGDSYNVKYSDSSSNKSPTQTFNSVSLAGDIPQLDHNSSPMEVHNGDLKSFKRFAREKIDESVDDGTTMGDYTTPFSKLDLSSSDYSTPMTPLIHTEPPMSDYSVDYAISKANADYNSKYLPSKIKYDVLYERLKSLMHYRPPTDTMPMYNYESSYHIDDNDIRTSSRGPYDNWPYYHYSPYDYEYKTMPDSQKVKDKRYASDVGSKIIPVHENEHDTPNELPYAAGEPYIYNNPLHGSLPFYSSIIPDYNPKTDEDPLTFKGLHWSDEYKNDHNNHETDALKKRNSGLYTKKHHSDQYKLPINVDNINAKDHGYDRSSQSNKHFDDYEKKHEDKSAHDTQYKNDANNYVGVKDFLDTFVNKVGSEDAKKHSNYVLQRNQDKGEKRKGFRRVYHKDEYQEDNEFYDNKNHHANGVEGGSLSAHNAGKEAFLKSHSLAAGGHNVNSINNQGNTHNNDYHKHHNGYAVRRDDEKDINKYRNIARQAAHGGDGDDYTNYYRSY